MSDALVGMTTTRRFLYAPNPSLAALTYTLWNPVGTKVLDAVATTNDGSGWYSVSVDGSSYLPSQGLYREQWRDDTADVLFDATFLVVAAGGLLVTRREIRHNVAHLVEDLRLGIVETATATSITDSDLIETGGEFRGYWAYLYQGTGVGQERRITSSAVGSLTNAKPWSPTPAPGDLYELHRRYSVQEYNQAIDFVLQQATLGGLLTVTDESTLLTSALEYPAPAGLHCISEIWTGTGESWTKLRADKQWDTLPGRRVIKLTASSAGNRLRLIGQMYPGRLWRDESFCDLSPDYVTFKAAAHLLSSAGSGPQIDPEQRLSKANAYHQQAEQVRPLNLPLANSHLL